MTENVESEDCTEDVPVLDERKHSKLISSIFTLTGRKHKDEKRTEVGKDVLPVNFDADAGKIRLSELIGSLNKSSSHSQLKNQLRLLSSRGKVVDTPLPKHQQLKIDRSVAYDEATREVSKWSSIVASNRKCDQMKFPLEDARLKVYDRADIGKGNHKARTPLEVEIASLLQSSSVGFNKTYKNLTAEEKRARAAMSLEKARERHAELCKHRAQVSYRTRKETRVKKIRSKSYRRRIRREKFKEQEKELEKMKTADPEAFLEKVEQAENARIKERLSLRHRSSSKFARRQMIYAKYDDQTRQSIQDMLEKSRELKKPNLVKADDTSDEEEKETEHVDVVEEEKSLNKNPWMKSGPAKTIRIKIKAPESFGNASSADVESRKDEVCEATSDVVKDESDEDEGMGQVGVDVSGDEDDDETVDGGELNADIDQLFDMLEKSNESDDKLNKRRERRCKSDEDEGRRGERSRDVAGENVRKHKKDVNFKSSNMKRGRDRSENDERDNKMSEKDKKDVEKVVKTEAEIFIDPKNVLKIVNSIESFEMPTVIEDEDDSGDEGDDEIMDISEAFADDDVIDNFTSEKNDFMDNQKLKDIDLHLPGWGDWGGEGIQPSLRKKMRHTIAAPPSEPRRDFTLGNVIINEKKDESAAKHQINALPFPFKSTEQLEKSISTPVGKTWNPVTAFKELTRPKVVTRLGSIIKPINKEETFKKHKSVAVGMKRETGSSYGNKTRASKRCNNNS